MSYYNLKYHLIFATKGRRRYLWDHDRADCFRYMAKIIKDEGGFVYEIGGMSDHVHILLSIPPTKAISDFVRNLKQRSSKEFNDGMLPAPFAWQEGYGIFTVSESVAPSVQEYIHEQSKHHTGFDSLTEFKRFLELNGIAYNPDFLGRT